MAKSIILLVFWFFSLPTAWGEKGSMLIVAATEGTDTDSLYEFSFTIKGLKSARCYIGYYYGDQTFVVDTAVVDTVSGVVRFRKEKKLYEGLYFIADTAHILFDFVLAGDKQFGIQTQLGVPYDSAVFSGLSENVEFFDLMRFTNQKMDEVAAIREKAQLLRRATKDPEVFAALDQQIQGAYSAVEQHGSELMAQYPDYFFSKVLRSGKAPVTPEGMKAYIDKKPNGAYIYYFRNHFWDRFDFGDERMLRTKLYANKLKTFFEQVTPLQVDSLKLYLDKMLGYTKEHPEYYAFTLRWLTKKFDENLDAPNADALLIYLVERYHHLPSSGTDKYTLERLDYKVKMFKPNLVGAIAPEISLPDTSGFPVSLAKVEAKNTLLFFYSSLCEHCRKATPKVIEAFKKYADKGLKTYAVCTDGDVGAWKAFQQEFQTQGWCNVLDQKVNGLAQEQFAAYNLPVIYLLDKDKKILAKRIKVEELEGYLGYFMQ